MTNKLLLKTLSIQNFATFEREVVNFKTGFNTIIGETGSGKSLILDALNLILGERADKKLIRKDNDFAIIEACFEAKGQEIQNYFNDIDHPFDNNEIIIKRVIYKSGTSKSFINFQTCSLNLLKKITKRYVDLVGQFENQKLLSSNYQLVLLDSYAGLSEQRQKYNLLYNKLQTLEQEYEQLLIQNQNSLQREDFLKYQLNEIEELSPSLNDEANLIKEKDNIIRLQTNSSSIEEINNHLTEGDENVLNKLKFIQKKLFNLDADEEVSNHISNAISEIEDLSYLLAKSFSPFESEDQLNKIIDRLDSYQKLKRKHGGSIESLLNSYKSYKDEFHELKNIDNTLKSYEEKISDHKEQCYALAHDLHKARVKHAEKLSLALSANIQSLNMKGAEIVVSLKELNHLTKFGVSHISFEAQTNPGEGFFPMKEIASGGELSRILLSMRKVLSSKDSVSIFLFDEIDTGIGGDTALKIGKSLIDVSSSSQVIAITHLPQIANFATNLIHVEKNQIKGEGEVRTISKISHINSSNKKAFISNMNPIQ